MTGKSVEFIEVTLPGCEGEPPQVVKVNRQSYNDHFANIPDDFTSTVFTREQWAAAQSILFSRQLPFPHDPHRRHLPHRNHHQRHR